ncbi:MULTISPECIES: hypothetical protein [unclassified Mesorhizobium]|uniref:hypothetical protein n=1 Tax=unclassified Mesorhizobium TaxID=325217 RepID=UPI0011274324|nr:MULTISPECIES: hypothetical protein [unclassified Mesorhizobium]MCA0002043.1 hypothetical protein [Mesorhizobium sp. B264B2A]MCA0006663.1 hypothetical protein [Mesorhizobium sp. B264B1B]MCA0017704.1 hypothetical protein [Mesorhizobium sp. B264B1A]TPJ45371.1 hypothetical protein FJ437_18420 [Mesorhizobium sp. B2-6-6]
MAFHTFSGRFFAGLALTGFMLAAAGCQSGDNGMLNLGFGKKDPTAPPPPQDPKILASQLNAYCPRVMLRDGTAFFNTYANEARKPRPKLKKTGDAAQDAAADAAAAAPPDDSARVIYQASISDVTRDCSRADGQLTMKIAVAGKIVPGPKFTPGTITMPIRTAVMHGTEVLYSQIHQYQVQVTDPSVATQFVFTDSNIVVPAPTAQDYQAYAGYDENAPKAATDKSKKNRKKAAATN